MLEKVFTWLCGKKMKMAILVKDNHKSRRGTYFIHAKVPMSMKRVSERIRYSINFFKMTRLQYHAKVSVNVSLKA